jgi:methylenetetrahydrofolate reductase (NADPH)
MEKQLVRDLVTGYSIETTVREAARIERFGDSLRPGTRVYIAHVPGTDWQETVTLATRLRHEQMEPVPHIVARRITGAAQLDDVLKKLVGEAGVKQVLAVAGDIAKPVGELDSALQMLEMGVFEKHGLRKIGVAGHPEGHKDVSDPVLKDALKRKNEYARRTGADVYIVTQFSFAAEPVGAWEAANGPDVNHLSFTVGVPGLATIKTLLKYALECGVGPSMHALSKHAASLTKLVTVAAPDELIVGLASYKARNTRTLMNGIHFFPFGGLKRTADWANKIVEGRFDLTAGGTGITVES